MVDRTDVGATNLTGKVRIYSGAQPADANSAPGGNLLCEIDLQDPAYGNATTAGTASALGVPLSGVGTAAAGAGTAAQSFRIVNRDEATVYDGSVTATGGGGDMTLDNVSIAEAQTVNITSLTYTQPGG